jgi:hypothetical protein
MDDDDRDVRLEEPVIVEDAPPLTPAEEIALLEDELAKRTEDTNNIRDRLAQHYARLRGRDDDPVSDPGSIPSRRRRRSSDSDDRPKTIKLALPDKYYGTWGKCTAFISKMRNYIDAYPRSFPNETTKIAFAASYLQDRAWDWYDGWSRRSETPPTFALFSKWLELSFGDPDKEGTAQRKLLTLKQTGRASEYWVEFNKLCLDVQWEDTALQYHFTNGLKPNVAASLAVVDGGFANVSILARKAIAVDDSLHRLETNRTHDRVGRYDHSRPNRFSGMDRKDHTQRPTNPRYSKEGGRSVGQTTRVTATMSDATWQYRMKNGDCLQCGSKDHRKNDCPELQGSNGKKAAFNKVTTDRRPDRKKPTPRADNSGSDGEGHAKLYAMFASSSPGDLLTTLVSIVGHPNDNPRAMLDSGATYNFIDERYAKALGLTLVLKDKPERLHLADGSEAKTGALTHTTDVTLLLGEGFNPYASTFHVTAIGGSPLVLGYPFFATVDPDIDWNRRVIRARRGAYEMHKPNASGANLQALGVRIMTMSAIDFQKDAEEGVDNEAMGVVYLRSAVGGSVEDLVEDVVPKDYHDLMDVFSKKDADTLPPHRSFDHRIPLTEGKQPTFGPIYSLSQMEQEEVQKYLDENLAKGFITPSESPAASPILFVKKKDGSLRLCVDYQSLNAITIKNRYPLPLIGDLIDQLRGAEIYTKMDLRGAYNLLRIEEGEEWKTAFRTRYGLFEYRVMPFGLTNAPASFQHLMNYIFRDLLDVNVIIYLDDILVYSRHVADCVGHVREVLHRLQKHQLYAKHTKCEFNVRRVEFLGFVITPGGVAMDQNKVKAVLEWPDPKNVKELQSLLGFANFYRRFIKNFSKMVTPLTTLTRKDATWSWGATAKEAVRLLRDAFTTAPVLAHFDPALPITLQTDASDYALGAILQQEFEGRTHPVAFYSRKFTPPELNYPVHNKEFLAIFASLMEWRHYLEGATHTVKVLTDHNSLEYFLTKRLLTRRQARWSESLADFDIRIVYQAGTKATLPDCLSRRPDYRPTDTTRSSRSEELNEHNMVAMLLSLRATEVQPFESWSARIAHCKARNELTTILEHNVGSVVKGADGLIRRGKALYVPKELRKEVLKRKHDLRTAGHPGRLKTYTMIPELFWWPTLKADTHPYVDTCVECQRTKVSHQTPAGELMPLPVAE